MECERWHVLPYAGGLDDQPAGEIPAMGYLLGVYNAFSFRRDNDFDNLTLAEKYPKVWRTISRIERMRMEPNG